MPLSSKVEVRKGAIHGFGWWALEDIEEGEPLYWPGDYPGIDTQKLLRTVTLKELSEIPEPQRSTFIHLGYQVDDDAFEYLILNEETPWEVLKENYVNHTCAPNCWYVGETITAMRKIKKGEEIAYDYASTESHGMVLFEKCRCGAPNCRGKVTGDDWKLLSVQQKLDGHFSTYLQKKVSASQKVVREALQLKKEKLLEVWKKEGQEHVFRFADSLHVADLAHLLDQLESIKVHEMNETYLKAKQFLEKSQTATASPSSSSLQPLPHVFRNLSAEDKAKFVRQGETLCAEGKVGVLLLAGGQGTRLGSSLPKGMYDIGLPSHKSLFQLQAERIKATQDLLSKKFNKEVHIPWYIMTSAPTYQNTINYFKSNQNFGLNPNNLVFFNQDIIPCLSPEGKIILESASAVACAPNGNGGMYQAMQKTGVLDDLKKRGVQYLTQYCVDNVLTKVVDPLFIGLAAAQNADVGVKVVEKAYPAEPVGLLVLKEGKPAVVEYSEISENLTKLETPDHKLVFGDSHICVNLFSSEFLHLVAASELEYHVAKKKIPYANDEGKTTPSSQINGWKLEKFIFDVFPLSKNIVALEVQRNEEFSPLKNAPGSKVDSPETCRLLLSQLHKSWIEKAGGAFTEDVSESKGCEVSPLVSLDGSGLESVKGKTFSLPLELK